LREELPPNAVLAFHARELPGYPVAESVRAAWDIEAIRGEHLRFIETWAGASSMKTSTALSMRAMLVADWLALLRVDLGCRASSWTRVGRRAGAMKRTTAFTTLSWPTPMPSSERSSPGNRRENGRRPAGAKPQDGTGVAGKVAWFVDRVHLVRDPSIGGYRRELTGLEQYRPLLAVGAVDIVQTAAVCGVTHFLRWLRSPTPTTLR
jgi:hypothetical protein